MAILKNTTINDTGNIRLPSGTTAQRPSNPQNGMLRFNTTLGYPEYYWMGFWINAETNKGGVPMDGLIFLIDAANPDSWDGTTLTDIIGGYDVALNGTINEGTLDWVDSQNSNATVTGSKYLYASSGNTIDMGNINVSSVTGDVYTVMTVCGYNGSTRGRITSTDEGGNNWLLGHHGGLDVCYYAEGWVIDQDSSGTGGPSNTWDVHVGTGDSKVDEWMYYKNGGYKVTTLSGGSQGPTNLRIGNWQSNNQPSDWKWQFLAVWDRVLGPQEIAELSGAIADRGNY